MVKNAAEMLAREMPPTKRTMVEGAADPLATTSRLQPTWRATPAGGADIPEELFMNIIQYLGIGFEDLMIPDERLRETGLLSGSLVCMHWARACRRALYQGRNLEISSRRQAERLRDLVRSAGSSKRLTPIVDMIRMVNVFHKGFPADGRSWSHVVVGALVPRLQPDRFDRFYIYGRSSSLPFGMRLGSPDWDVQKTLPHTLTPYRRLGLIGVHFPSLSYFCRFLRHFPRLEELDLYQVTWDKADWHPRPLILTHHPDRGSLTDINIDDCTDGLLLWQLIQESQLRSLLQACTHDDQQAISQLVTSAYTAVKGKRQGIVPVIGYRQWPSDGGCLLTVRFEIKSHVTFDLICHSRQQNPLLAVGSLQVVGCVLVVNTAELPQYELRAYAEHSFWPLVLQLPHLRGLIFGMADDNAHQILADAHPGLRQLNNPQIESYRFVSLENAAGDEQKWVARDPLSLDTTGETWKCTVDVFNEVDCNSLVNELKQRILQ